MEVMVTDKVLTLPCVSSKSCRFESLNLAFMSALLLEYSSISELLTEIVYDFLHHYVCFNNNTVESACECDA